MRGCKPNGEGEGDVANTRVEDVYQMVMRREIKLTRVERVYVKR